VNSPLGERPDTVIDWPPPRRPRRRLGIALLAVIVAAALFGRTALSYYVDALWFDSLGYISVFWTTLNLQAIILVAFALLTFFILYGSFLALKPARLGEFSGILINGQPLRLPVDPVLKLIAGGLALLIAVVTGLGLMSEWLTLALYWYAPASAATPDPVFGRPVSFYLFTLPAWDLIAGWATTLAVLVAVVAVFFLVVSGGTRALLRQRAQTGLVTHWKGVSIALSVLLLTLAAQAYLGRFEQLFQNETIFSGVTYTDAHVTLTGMLIVAWALIVGAVIAAINAAWLQRPRWLLVAVAPALLCYAATELVAGYVGGFIVKPNQLVKERPFISYNIQWTRQAFALDRIEEHPFPAEAGLEALDVSNNQPTLQNVRLWDWRALQDTLRQIQEIRTYYDFPDIDIDRYEVGGATRQMMLAVRELSINKLPESSRNWINEQLVYTHGYGVTMNPVNGFTPEGLPLLVLSNMPIQSTVPDIKVTRPQIYFGQQTTSDVYVKTRQKEFDYPQGEANSVTSYAGSGGIVIGGFLRRILLAFDRGDITKLPFSDDVTPDSRLMMRRTLRERIEALAPFLTLDPDPYMVVGADGHLTWMIDAFTTSDTYPYARHATFFRDRINYIRNSVKVAIDAYDGTATFYVFDPDDPIITAYRALFPHLFKDKSAMPADLMKHVRYPELLLQVQAAMYGLYHMTNPDVFYNREDLWTVANEVGMGEQRQQVTQAMEPNFVLMTLPGERAMEFIGILPFTPANRNNLIGWIAGRSDASHYGTAVVYNFPKTKLVDGPLQIEARIDQNAQLSGQLTLWNQQGSHVRRGSLIVMPIGRGLLYAEPIYLQAERSPMPELRLVVLASQDRLGYGPSFDAAMAALVGSGTSTTTAQPFVSAPITREAPPPERAEARAPRTEGDVLVVGAAQDLAEYQRLTAEGKLGDAGRKLEELKEKLDRLNARGR
jgi:uncharacterized membrane protein (UPF0182 family)